MGIKDLLRFMKPYSESINVEKYAGKRVGIDAYSWLHKGAYSCSMELCLNSNSDKKLQYINYFMHRIDLLRFHKVTPVVVFDGGNIPCKAATEEDRHRKREANRELAMQKLKEGNINAATDLFQRAISITTSMAHQLIQTLKAENVEYMVAPYEADAQLAYLSGLGDEQGGVTAVITEDSDLLAYGCPAVIFKMDRFGNGEEILLDKVFSSTTLKPSFRRFNRELFTGMCVLAGCDFLSSVPGIGIAKAHALVSKYYNIKRVLSVLKFEKSNQMPEDYTKSFAQAVAVFQHARIYDKATKRIQHLKPLSDEVMQELDGEVDFLGLDLPPSIAKSIAEAKLDPITMEAYNCSSIRTPRRRFPSAFTQSLKSTTRTTEESCFTTFSSQQSVTMENSTYDSSSTQTSRRRLPSAFKQSHKTTTSTTKEESCFTIFSSQKSSTTVHSHTAKSAEIAQRQVLKERNYSDEALLLAKLVAPPSPPPKAPFSSFCEDSLATTDENCFKTPNNNPFKKRKHNEVVSPAESGEVEMSGCPSALSCLTEEVQSNRVVITNDSPCSVESKPKRIEEDATGEGDNKKKRLSKKANNDCKKFSSKKSTSILNFFSRA